MVAIFSRPMSVIIDTPAKAESMAAGVVRLANTALLVIQPSGADLWASAATVKLIRPQFGEFVPVNYSVVDATRIVAVFDLRNAPLGLYDLQVANPTGAIAILPYRFMVSPARPLDATVGLGGPDEILLSKAGFPNATYFFSLLSLTNVDASRAGTYTVSETQPAAWGDGRDTLGSVGGVATNDLFTAIILGGH